MRVFICCVVLAVTLPTAPILAETTSPYTRVATGRAPQKDAGKVYTNADLEKLVDSIAEEHGEQPPADVAGASAEESEKPDSKSDTDPLTWLQQRQSAQREHRQAVSEAQAAVNAARQNLANLERQLLAARNPFSARPQLSDEEKTARREDGETAAERHERTKELVEKARAEIQVAEAELVRLQAERL